MNKTRTISIDPQFLNISKKKVKTKPLLTNEININSGNIKQLLLEKLRHHKKTKKNIKQPIIQLNSFDEQANNFVKPPQPIKLVEPVIDIVKIVEPLVVGSVTIDPVTVDPVTVNPVTVNPVTVNPDTVEPVTVEPVTELDIIEIKPDKPYGILKNGTKPTYKVWNKLPNNEIKSVVIEEEIPIIEEREVKKTYLLGKHKKNKSVSILIKNNTSRKKIEMDKIGYKKTSITTLKNHLKKHNLIKFGTTAPSELLRTMYENSKLCGEIINENAVNIIHNFKEH